MAEQVRNILLIEDNPVESKLVQKILTKSKEPAFNLECCGTLKDGVTRLGQPDYLEVLDLVILDLTLPDSDGLDTYEKVQAQAPEVAVVVMTGADDERMGLEAVRNGAQDFLTKGSFDNNLLLRSINYAIERSELHKNLEQMVLTDPLTGLLNRRGLEKVLARQISWIRRGIETVALLIDLDDFKKVNDSMGHAAGDVLLQEVAKRLKATLRSTDFIARIGGDEFMVLLPRTRIAETVLVGEKLRQAVSTVPMVMSRSAFKVTASMGVVRVSTETPSIDELLAKTHLAMSRGKLTGKDKVVFEEDVKPSTAKKEYTISEVLEMLNHRDSFRVVKHPLMAIPDQTVVGYEFLSRFCVEAFQAPDDFFRMCQENNLLGLVDHYCFKNCIKATEDLPEGLRFHFNLFPSTLLGIDPHNLIQDFPQNYREGSFCIEISEQQIIGDSSNLLGPVNAFRKAGVLIAMDDVGFGQSNLESLIMLEPDVVKIDKRCIIGIAEDVARQRSLTRLLTVLNSLKVEVIAEGVETEDDLKIVESHGIKYAQGFFWGKPS